MGVSGVSSFKPEVVKVFCWWERLIFEGEIMSLEGRMSYWSVGEENRSLGKGETIE